MRYKKTLCTHFWREKFGIVSHRRPEFESVVKQPYGCSIASCNVKVILSKITTQQQLNLYMFIMWLKLWITKIIIQSLKCFAILHRLISSSFNSLYCSDAVYFGCVSVLTSLLFVGVQVHQAQTIRICNDQPQMISWPPIWKNGTLWQTTLYTTFITIIVVVIMASLPVFWPVCQSAAGA